MLPLVDQIAEHLQLLAGSFALSGVNLGAASNLDVGVEVSGFSADLPAFMALLSARLSIPLTQETVCTGHIASLDGEVRLVRNLPAQLLTARQDRSISRFIYPDLESDLSMAVLAKSEGEQIEAALAEASHDVTTVGVRDVAELLRAVFSEEALIMGALETGYFGLKCAPTMNTAPASQAAQFLCCDMTRRLFAVLESKLMAGECAHAGALLGKWMNLQVARGCYPRGVGRKLQKLVLSIPPLTRARHLQSPLVPVRTCIVLSQCASESDFDDVLELYRSVSRSPEAPGRATPLQSRRLKKRQRTGSSTLEIVVADIEREHLTRTICLPIDAARASFLLESVTAESHREVLEVVTPFYIHLMRYTHRMVDGVGLEEAGPAAYALLDHAFARTGGTADAMAEARCGARGGLRFVLDQMTDQFKRERQEEYVLQVVATAIDPLDWPAKVAFMKELLSRYPEAMPAELASEPPERFAAKYDQILRAYVNSIDHMKQVLRAL